MKHVEMRNALCRSLDLLGISQSGEPIASHPQETALDELFNKLAISYNTYPNQFFRAELAESFLKDILFRSNPTTFRDLQGNQGGEGDIQWCFNGEWIDVSIKYKGPDRRNGIPIAPTGSMLLSALGWQTTNNNRKFNSPMIVIWDANRKSSGQRSTSLDYEKCLWVCMPHELNQNVTFQKKNSKTDTAMKLSGFKVIFESNQRNHIKNRVQGRHSKTLPVRLLPQAHIEMLRIGFSIEQI